VNVKAVTGRTRLRQTHRRMRDSVRTHLHYADNLHLALRVRFDTRRAGTLYGNTPLTLDTEAQSLRGVSRRLRAR
jgi:hypothetical protein